MWGIGFAFSIGLVRSQNGEVWDFWNWGNGVWDYVGVGEGRDRSLGPGREPAVPQKPNNQETSERGEKKKGLWV